MIKPAFMLAAILTIGSAPASAADIRELFTSKKEPIIAIVGDIEIGDDARFKALALKHPKAAVALSSEGGRLQPALEIGRAIHLMGYSTMVPTGQTCASACALVWLAGSPRVAEETAKIGFHAGYRVDNKRAIEDGMANALIGRYLTQLNLPVSGIMAATAATPDEMLWLDTSDPGSEGIPYETFISERTKNSTPPPLIRTNKQPEMVAREEEEDENTETTAYGAWRLMAFKDTGGYALVSKAQGGGEGFLSYICVPGEACQHALNTGMLCEAKTTYNLKYRVDSKPAIAITGKCLDSGDGLALNDTATFNGNIEKARSLAFVVTDSKGVPETLSYSLNGYQQALGEMISAGNIKRVNE